MQHDWKSLVVTFEGGLFYDEDKNHNTSNLRDPRVAPWPNDRTEFQLIYYVGVQFRLV